jgi:uncharacterized protein YsxB (DUF464 family)
MAGQLQTHPYFRTFDELQRSIKRMRTYLDMNWDILPDDEKDSIQIMIEKMEVAERQVPEKYRVTKHFQYKDK